LVQKRILYFCTKTGLAPVQKTTACSPAYPEMKNLADQYLTIQILHTYGEDSINARHLTPLKYFSKKGDNIYT
jgi:hypothetical protein